MPCHPTIQADLSEVHGLGQCHLEFGQCLQAYTRVYRPTQAKKEVEWVITLHIMCMHITLHVYFCVLTLVTASGLNTNTELFGYLIRRSPDSSTVFTMPTLSTSWRKNKRHLVVYCNTTCLAVMRVACILAPREYISFHLNVKIIHKYAVALNMWSMKFFDKQRLLQFWIASVLRLNIFIPQVRKCSLNGNYGTWNVAVFLCSYNN